MKRDAPRDWLFLVMLVVVGLLAWYGASRVIGNEHVAARDDGKRDATGSVEQFPAEVASRPVRSSRPFEDTSPTFGGPGEVAARDVFVDESLDLRTRFDALVEREDEGSLDTRHLVRMMVLDCDLYRQMSRETVLPEVWSRDMEVALARAKAQCLPLESRVDYQRLREETRNQPRDTTDDDVRRGIRRAFADGGAEAAEVRALEYYRVRPDQTTARVIVEVWDELGIIAYDQRFVLRGSAVITPVSRREVFHSALVLLACDLGVPCGPQSEVVMKLCTHSVCAPGLNLYQLYRDRLLPGETMQGVDSVLQGLRQLLAR